jgi:hypothetical protein
METSLDPSFVPFLYCNHDSVLDLYRSLSVLLRTLDYPACCGHGRVFVQDH